MSGLIALVEIVLLGVGIKILCFLGLLFGFVDCVAWCSVLMLSGFDFMMV